MAVRIVPSTQKLADENVQKLICCLVSLLLKRAASFRLSGELGVDICVRAKSREPTAGQVKDNKRMGHPKGRLRPEEKRNLGKDAVEWVLG